MMWIVVILMGLTFICLFIAPVPMVTVGSYYLNLCGPSPPFYTIWLIVGGVVTAFFFLSLMGYAWVASSPDSYLETCLGIIFIILGLGCFVVALGWVVAGCVYMTSQWMSHLWLPQQPNICLLYTSPRPRDS